VLAELLSKRNWHKDINMPVNIACKNKNNFFNGKMKSNGKIELLRKLGYETVIYAKKIVDKNEKKIYKIVEFEG